MTKTISINGRWVDQHETLVYERLLTAPLSDKAGWYEDAYTVCEMLTEKYRLNHSWMTAFVVALISPRKRWDINVRDAETCIAAAKSGQVDRLGLFKWQRQRIKSLFQTETMPRLGQKSLSFFWCLMGEQWEVAIDRHVMACVVGVPIDKPSGDIVPSTPKAYRRIREICFDVAACQGLTPREWQERMWVVRQGS